MLCNEGDVVFTKIKPLLIRFTIVLNLYDLIACSGYYSTLNMYLVHQISRKIDLEFIWKKASKFICALIRESDFTRVMTHQYG